MQDYSYIYVPVMVLTNTAITPSSHNLKQRKCFRAVYPESIFLLKAECNTYILFVLRSILLKQGILLGGCLTCGAT